MVSRVTRPSKLTVSCSILLSSLATGPPALAQEAPSSDPGADSAPGAVYQLPLESGRDDAAPAGTRRGDRAPGRRSAIRSEKGFASSTRVPGAEELAAGRGEREGAGGDGSGRGDASGSRQSGSEDSDGGGAPPGATRRAPALTEEASGAGSDAGTYGLLGLALLVAVGLGGLVRRVART